MSKRKELFFEKYKREIWFKNSDKIWKIELDKNTLRVYLRKEINETEKETLKLKDSRSIKYKFIVEEPPKIRLKA